MSDTHINAYKEELVNAKVALEQAKGRVAELEDYIKANEPQESTTQAESKEKTSEKSSSKSQDEGEKVEVKTSKDKKKDKK